MKKLLSALALSLVACSPQTYQMMLETRNASESGIDIGGRSIALVYLEPDSPRDSSFNNFFSDGFSKGLGTDYTNVPVFSVKESADADYSSRDSLVSFILDTEADVVMFFDKPEFGIGGRADSAMAVMYLYDSMGKADSVLSFNRTVRLTGDDEMIYSDAQFSGFEWALQFIPRWKNEQFTFVYFNSSSWITSLYYAENFQWDKAIEIWMEKMSSSSVQTRSCAAYDIALAEYLVGDYKLALEWLDYSDSCSPLLLGRGLRKRIQEKLD